MAEKFRNMDPSIADTYEGIRCDHRSDGGRVIRVLRNADLHIPQALEVLDDLAALEEFSQSADQDILFDAGAHRCQDSCLADILDHHMYNTCRDILRFGLGICLTKIRSRHIQIQARQLFFGQICDPQVYLRHITLTGQRHNFMNVAGIQHDRGQSTDRSAS